MTRSLSLAAYRALSRRKVQSGDLSFAQRPKGELVWAHATTETRMSALCDLGTRLKSQRPGLNLLLTLEPERMAHPSRLPDGADWIYPISEDHPADADRFLAHWQPDVGLWAGGSLKPNLICTAAAQSIPMILLDAEESEFQTRQYWWSRDLTRNSLGCFRSIVTDSVRGSKLLTRLGAPEDTISIASRLREGVAATAYDEDALTVVTQSLVGQPVWLAAHVQAAEIDAVVRAHRNAIRFSHRLLLVIVLSDPNEIDHLKAALDRSGLRHVTWQPGDGIEDSTQVVVVDDQQDLGLWYRVAPLTFMASSMMPGFGGRGPFEAAALGSAILYGPNVGNYLDAYARLSAVGAARTVRNAEGLGAAVVQLIAPDHSATMALAGWEVVTESAHLTDSLVEKVQDLLDLSEARHARA